MSSSTSIFDVARVFLVGAVVLFPLKHIALWSATLDRSAISYQVDFCEAEHAPGEHWVLEPWSTASSLVGIAYMLWVWRCQHKLGAACHKSWAIFCVSFFCGTVYHATGKTPAVLGSFWVGSFFANVLIGELRNFGVVSARSAGLQVQSLWAFRMIPVLAWYGKGHTDLSVAHATLVLITGFTAVVTMATIWGIVVFSRIDCPKIKRHASYAMLLGVKDSLAQAELPLCRHSVGLGVFYHSLFHIVVCYSVTHMCLLIDELRKARADGRALKAE